MPNIIDILARALSLRQETALNSITPNRAGGIMYDTLLVLNQMQLEGGALLISKVYASVSAMEADTTPTSDLTGRALKPGQLVVIVTSDASSSDMGSEYRFNGPGSWTYVGKVGGLPLDTVPTQSSTRGITSGGVYTALAAMKAEGYKYMGIATPGSGGTAPGTPNQPVFYIAGPGSYPNFGSITVASGYLGFIKYSGGSWSVESVAVGKDYDEQISQLQQKVDAQNIYDFGAIPTDYWEIGNVTMSASGWVYSASNSRVRIKSGIVVHLMKGTIIKFNTWTGKRMYISWRLADGTYKTSNGWKTSDYVAPDEGDYVFLLTFDPEVTVDNASDLYGDFAISSASDIVSRVPDLEGEVQDKLISSKSSTSASGNLATNVAMGFLYRVEITLEGTLDHTNSRVRISDTSSGSAIWSPLFFKVSSGIPVYIPIFGNPSINASIRVDFSFTSETHSISVSIYRMPLLKMETIKSLSVFSYTHPVTNFLDFSFVQGEWTSFGQTNLSTSWCSTTFQFNRGRKIKITFGSGFYVSIRGAIFDQETNSLTPTPSFIVPTSGTIYDTSLWFMWAVQVRRTNYARLLPTEAAAAVTIEDMGGELYAKEVTSVDADYFTTKTRNRVSALEVETQRNFRLGTLEYGRIYHHINVESSTFIVPSQSLYDIAYAKMLGFEVIEANLKTCSDGVVVVKHGTADGGLGQGLIFASGSGYTESTKFSEITSTALRQNVTYDSQWPKFRSHIPTLDEFCAECARLDMIPYLRGINATSLAIARKYFPDEKMIIEGVPRGDFKGLMTIYGSLSDPDDILAVCKNYGSPFYYGYAAGAVASDESVSNVVKKLHENGFMVAVAYVTAQRYKHLAGLGVDFLASTTEASIPAFYEGNALNIVGCSSEELTLVGATYDSATGTIAMAQDDLIRIYSDKLAGNASKICLRIIFDGVVDISFGSDPTPAQSFTDLASNGEQANEIALAVSLKNSPVVSIKAKSATTIKDIAVYGSMLITQ